MKLMDCHVHTKASYDSDAALEDICFCARRLGLAGVTVTDHADLAGAVPERLEETVTESTASVRAAQEKFPDILVCQGIEMGEGESDRALAERILESASFDMVLASVHRVGDMPDYYFVDFYKSDIRKLMTDYFEQVHRTVEWGRFHSLAHLTYPFRYMPIGSFDGDYRPWQPLIDDILRQMGHRNLALEINTSGLRTAAGTPAVNGVTSPDFPLIKRFRELGGRMVTLGSDAHTAADTGSGLEKAAALAKKAGFEAATYFVGGRPVQIQLG